MRIIGFMVCGPNEKYLEGTLKEFKRLCDDAVIVGNNTDPKTEKLIKQYGYWFYRDDREWGLYQPVIKSDLLQKIGKLNPDWIIPLDADERFAPEFTREKAEELANRNEIAYNFLIVNLYNDPDHFYHGVGIQRFWNVRFYKYLPEYGLQFQNKKVHCGLAPPICYNYAWHAPYYVAHYGLMLKEDRLRKAARYDKYDPKAQFKSREYYDDLVADHTPMPFDRIALLNQLQGVPDTQIRKRPDIKQEDMKIEKYFYVRRLSDGKMIDVPERHLEMTLARGGFELIGPVGLTKSTEAPVVEAPVVETPVQEEEKFECILCGWTGKNERVLKSHKTRKHG